MAGASIIVDDHVVVAAVTAIAAKGGAPARLLNRMAAAMLLSVQRRFETESAPDGSKWARLSKRTLARRAKGRANRDGMPAILRDRGQLYHSIHSGTDGNSAVVGTNLVYARIHQEGGPITRHARSTWIRLRKVGGKTRFARKAHKRAEERRVTIGEHSIIMPARPYLGFSDADKVRMAEIVTEYFEGRPA